MCKDINFCINDEFSPAFLTFFNSPAPGTFTGLIFTATVTPQTPPGLYNINVTLPDLSQLFLRVIPVEGGETFSARENISVLVSGQVHVPDRGSSILL